MIQFSRCANKQEKVTWVRKNMYLGETDPKMKQMLELEEKFFVACKKYAQSF